MSEHYAGLGDEQRPRVLADHTAKWKRLRPIGSAGERVRREIERFCERKRITFAALEQLGTRVTNHRRDVGPCLAYAGTNGDGRVIAIKYRPINGSSHDSFAEEPSVWLRPIVLGDPSSLDWLILEGETDAARLFELVGDHCAILVLPTGAAVFRKEWADPIPRGARIGLCHDADKDGDVGANKAAEILGANVLRIRPPIEGGDWCDWDGDRAAFLELAEPRPRFQFSTFAEFKAHGFPDAEPLLGRPGKVFLAVGSLLLVYGADGCGKSTWMIDGGVHLAAGADWLELPVPRPVRVLIIENEGPGKLFQDKLDAKVEAWTGEDPTGNLFALMSPWGRFSFADPGARDELRSYCDENRVELVIANPTLGLGVGTSGRPDETAEFVEWLGECGLWNGRAFALAHHENKLGQISGDWGRHPDTYARLQSDGNRQRTRLTWAKTRWATLEPDEKAVMLEWITESWGYRSVPLEAANRGATDAELDDRIRVFLSAHPCSTTRTVQAGIEGTDKRIRTRLEANFDSVVGPRNAILWLNPAAAVVERGGTSAAAPPQSEENRDE